jgi:fructose-1,6-bisphosphatase/inositol monophosphatase family enzyme
MTDLTNADPSTADPTRTDVELAGDLVRRAGDLALRMLRDGLTVEAKTSISDVVSDADKAAEALIVHELAQLRPDDGVVGEEGAAAPGERTWVIDPVDGTYNFVSGLPAWCSALALTDATGTPLVGAVYQPTTDELWIGGPDHRTTRNGEPVAPLVDRPLAEVSIASYLHPGKLTDPEVREPLLAGIAGAAALRIVGSGSVELAAVAAGRIGVWLHVDTLSWDWLPGAALVRGAGGVAEVVEHRGHRYHLAGLPTAVAQARQAVLAAG